MLNLRQAYKHSLRIEKLTLHSLVYPNPVVIRLNFDKSLLGSNNVLQVYNLFGNKVMESILQNINSIDLSHLLNGIYICRLKSDNSESIFRIIKIK